MIEPKSPGRGTSTSHANRIPLQVGGYSWRKDEPDAQPTPREDKYRPPRQERRYLDPPTLRETCGRPSGRKAHYKAGERPCDRCKAAKYPPKTATSPQDAETGSSGTGGHPNDYRPANPSSKTREDHIR